MNINLTDNQTNSINSLLFDFEIELKKQYPNIQDKNIRFEKYFSKIILLYDNDSFFEIKNQNSFIIKHLPVLKKNKLLSELWIKNGVESNYSKEEVDQWLDSIIIVNNKIDIENVQLVDHNSLLEGEKIIDLPSLNNNDSKLKRDINTFNFEINSKGLFYFAIFNSTCHKKYKDYIASRLSNTDIHPIIPLNALHNMSNNKETNLVKTLLLFEYIIPLYLHE